MEPKKEERKELNKEEKEEAINVASLKPHPPQPQHGMNRSKKAY